MAERGKARKDGDGLTLINLQLSSVEYLGKGRYKAIFCDLAHPSIPEVAVEWTDHDGGKLAKYKKKSTKEAIKIFVKLLKDFEDKTAADALIASAMGTLPEVVYSGEISDYVGDADG